MTNRRLERSFWFHCGTRIEGTRWVHGAQALPTVQVAGEGDSDWRRPLGLGSSWDMTINQDGGKG